MTPIVSVKIRLIRFRFCRVRKLVLVASVYIYCSLGAPTVSSLAHVFVVTSNRVTLLKFCLCVSLSGAPLHPLARRGSVLRLSNNRITVRRPTLLLPSITVLSSGA